MNYRFHRYLLLCWLAVFAPDLVGAQTSGLLPDSILVWGPVLGMKDGTGFVYLDTNYPVTAHLTLNGGAIDLTDRNFAYHKAIQLPGNLRGNSHIG